MVLSVVAKVVPGLVTWWSLLTELPRVSLEKLSGALAAAGAAAGAAAAVVAAAAGAAVLAAAGLTDVLAGAGAVAAGVGAGAGAGAAVLAAAGAGAGASLLPQALSRSMLANVALISVAERGEHDMVRLQG